ncbi:MAG: sigma-70 family RNA polymerase sigma factor [Planctomycetota bacterium]
MSTDTDLVRRCLDGDRLGWADLLARYGDLIYGLFHRAGLDKTSAADGFQEVSILLWKSLKKLRRAESLVPWIATTTKRIAWRMKQRSRSRADRDASVARPEADTGGGPDDTVAQLEEEQRVREALATLGERCRRLLAALYFQPGEGGYDEIAERLGIPRGSIGPTRQRCLEGLRRELLARGFPAGDEGPPADVSPGGSAASPPARDVPRRRRGSLPKGPS